jgi:CMP/dCMP kinase
VSTFLLDRCTAYLLAQARLPENQPERQLPVVTLSRETGAGAGSIGHLVTDYLQTRQKQTSYPWAVFDRNLVEKVLEEHMLPKKMERYMPEDDRFSVRTAIEEILGLHPATWTLTEHTSHAIANLAKRGNVVLVGRGSHIIAAGQPHVFHVRLVAPFEIRVQHAAKYYHLGEKEAVEFARNSDHTRARYVSHHFNARIDNPLAYHLTINTGWVSFEEAAEMIGEAVLRRETNSEA